MSVQNADYHIRRGDPLSAQKTKILPLCLCAVLAALTFALTFVNIRLPIPGNGGLVHLGNLPVVVAAVVLGKKYSAAAGALGMTLFDLVGGWFLWAPFTFVIRLTVGLVLGLFAEKRQGRDIRWNLAGVLISGVILVAGYYAAEWILYGSPFAPAASVPGNVLQVVSAAVLGVPLGAAAKKALPKA
ncbi:MAG: ECF transporter S component [Clostridium sp.]|jgi:uncharacterized membrane protein|nr:ECF transporter S component [Clostridium sp.]